MKRSATITKQPGAKRFKTTASKTKVTARSYIKRPLRTLTELKRVDDLTFNTTIGTAGQFFPLPCPSPGDSAWDREGRSIKVVGFQSLIKITPNFNISSCVVRVVYFLWKQGLQTPTVQDILKGINIHATYNVEQSQNYHIISDKFYNLNSKVQEGQTFNFEPNIQVVHDQFNFSFLQNFMDATPTPLDNRLYAYVVASSPTTELEGNAAVTFVDI